MTTDLALAVRTRDDAGDLFRDTMVEWPYLADLEVQARRPTAAVVVVGDSITDGAGATVDGNTRYPDALARRLAASTGLPRLAVQNAGIAGNRLLGGAAKIPSFGPALLDRIERDVADQAGARVVIVLAGTNDLGRRVAPASAGEVIAGLETAVARVHAAGLPVLLGTPTPCKNAPGVRHGTPKAIAARNRVNDWIRASGVADGVIDFHAAVRDPADPDRLRAEYDSGDGLHPNAAGYDAMAAAIDPALLRDAACAARPGGGAVGGPVGVPGRGG